MVSWKYIAQNVLTGEFLSMELPLTTAGPTHELSAAGSLSATIAPQMRYIVPLEEWQTAIYAECDGEIRWGGILHSVAPEGAVLSLEVAGFSSYPEGIPYTGTTYSRVGGNPTQVFYDLWNHLQSQTDGDLGVNIIMPTPACTATVGTTEEPYTLAPEEAPDIGEELSQLVSDTPFEYVERHYWADNTVQTQSANPATAVSWLMGYGNLEGGYNATDHGAWMTKRAPDQADFILDMGVDIFAAVELHEETSKEMPKGAHKYFEGLIQKLNSKWKLSVGNGGNHLLYNSKVFAVLAVKNRDKIDDSTRTGKDNFRSTSTFTVQHLDSGLVFKIKIAHLHANDDTGASRAATREAEAKDIVKDMTSSDLTILVGDMNEWDMGTHDPPRIYSDAGFKSMKQRMSGMPNSNVNSSKSGTDGHWIEGFWTRLNDFDVSEGAGVGTDGLSDHQLWMKMRVTGRDVVMSSRTARDYTPNQIRHEIVIGWPRLGRKRDDLSFIQGDNVISLLPVTRNGDQYANAIIGLGKGEGTGMVRAEIAQRDGRLRRPAVFTDKLADTAARLSAECRTEFAKRQLLPEISSITVKDHPNAPMGSWALGDDILVQGQIPWVGNVSIWCRVVGWSGAGEDRAILTLTRSDVAAGEATGSLLNPENPTTPTIDVPPVTGSQDAVYDEATYDDFVYA